MGRALLSQPLSHAVQGSHTRMLRTRGSLSRFRVLGFGFRVYGIEGLHSVSVSLISAQPRPTEKDHDYHEA